MQVTAYKDPATGQLFETEKQLTQFQTNRSEQAAVAAKARATHELQQQVRMTLVRELRSKGCFKGLARRMYNDKLARLKPKRNREPLQFLDLRIGRWVLDSSLVLHVSVEVVLSGKPTDVYVESILGLSPSDVLYPFQLDGCGCGQNGTNNFSYRFDLKAELAQLPVLQNAMRKAARLQHEAEQHASLVQQQIEQVQSTDAQLITLTQQVDQAAIVLETAQEAYRRARDSQGERAHTLTQQVQDSSPFAQAIELTRLTRATGLDSMGLDECNARVVQTALLDYFAS